MSTKNLKQIADKAKKNDFISISELMTGIENKVFSRKEVSQLIFKESHDSLKIGITGPPGAGKSSITNELITKYRILNKSVAVIGVDPTSPFTGGALLGDRLRMAQHFSDDGVYIRSMASRGSQGGLSDKSHDVGNILDCAGFDIIIYETVGVGQIELDVMKSSDLVLSLIHI